jgi:hypothetical protein
VTSSKKQAKEEAKKRRKQRLKRIPNCSSQAKKIRFKKREGTSKAARSKWLAGSQANQATRTVVARAITGIAKLHYKQANKQAAIRKQQASTKRARAMVHHACKDGCAVNGTN